MALSHAERHDRVRRNAAALVDAPKVPRTELQPFSAAQARTLLASTSGVAPVIAMAVGTGARMGELLALRWSDLDLKRRRVTISHTLQRDGTLAEAKTERSRRTVPLPRVVADAIRRHKAAQARQRLAAGRRWHDGDFVFTRDDGRPLSDSVVRRRYYREIEAAGLPKRHFHHLRHACVSLHLEAGEDIANVSRMLGHSSIRVTADVYHHLTPATEQRMADRMDDILTG